MDDVSELLSAWELADLIPTFTENAITMEALASLTQDIIKDIIPKAGPRALFNRCWRAWLTEYSKASESLSLANISDLDISTAEFEFFNSGSSKAVVPESSEIYTVVPVPALSVQTGILKELLQENLEGTGLLEYVGGILPGDSSRNLLAAIIAKSILKDTKNNSVRGETYYKWCTEIKNLFSGERTTTYYIPACKTASGTVHQARGKLVSQLLNTRRRFQKQGALTVNVKRSRESSPASSTSSNPSARPLPESLSAKLDNEEMLVDLEENLQWLRNSSDPWQLVQEKWEQTSENRLRKIHSEPGPTIEEYLDEFPALRKPLGYCLLELDFKNAYPDSVKNIYLNFPLVKANLLQLIKQRKTKDHFMREIVDLSDSPNEEVTNVVALMAIPLLLPSPVTRPDKKKKKGCSWKPTKAEARDAFITHVRSHTEIKDTIIRRLDKLIDKGVAPQPFCIIVGPTIPEVQSYFVVLNKDVLYERTNILATVDTCFKSIWALNAEYSFDSYCTWFFIQRGLYKLTSKFDKGSTAAESLLTDCKIIS